MSAARAGARTTRPRRTVWHSEPVPALPWRGPSPLAGLASILACLTPFALAAAPVQARGARRAARRGALPSVRSGWNVDRGSRIRLSPPSRGSRPVCRTACQHLQRRSARPVPHHVRGTGRSERPGAAHRRAANPCGARLDPPAQARERLVSHPVRRLRRRGRVRRRRQTRTVGRAPVRPAAAGPLPSI